MTSNVSEKLRDKDQVVLQHIGQGDDDVQRITAATTLENHHVTYTFQKLEDLGLIEVEKPDEMIERVIDGQKRVFQHPKQAELTDDGKQYLEESEQDEIDEYEHLTNRELIDKVHELENRIQTLEQKFQMFRKQIQKKLN